MWAVFSVAALQLRALKGVWAASLIGDKRYFGSENDFCTMKTDHI